MQDKRVEIALLFDFYGQLLTEKQIDIVDLYYNNDLSLSEISEQLNISRQGVYDTLKRAEFTLHEYEKKLGLVERFLEQKKNLSEILIQLNKIIEYDNNDVNDIKNRLKNIKNYIGKFI